MDRCGSGQAWTYIGTYDLWDLSTLIHGGYFSDEWVVEAKISRQSEVEG